MYCKQFIDQDAYLSEDRLAHLGFIKDMDDSDLILSFYLPYLDHGGESTKVLNTIKTFLTELEANKCRFCADNKPPVVKNLEFSGTFYIIASLLTQANLLNSGVSIRWSWLTEKGTHFLDDIKEIK